jgi:hypothetical protein
MALAVPYDMAAAWLRSIAMYTPLGLHPVAEICCIAICFD